MKKSIVPVEKADSLYISVNEAANILGIHKKTVYKAIKSGLLAAKRFGRVFRVPRCAVLPDGATLRGIGRVSLPALLGTNPVTTGIIFALALLAMVFSLDRWERGRAHLEGGIRRGTQTALVQEGSR